MQVKRMKQIGFGTDILFISRSGKGMAEKAGYNM
jgi:hypothetical protein